MRQAKTTVTAEKLAKVSGIFTVAGALIAAAAALAAPFLQPKHPYDRASTVGDRSVSHIAAFEKSLEGGQRAFAANKADFDGFVQRELNLSRRELNDERGLTEADKQLVLGQIEASASAIRAQLQSHSRKRGRSNRVPSERD